LEESYDQIKKENKSMKNKNGTKEALRAEVEKCHQRIDSLKKENNLLKRNQN
jgi:phage shock protein A